MKGLELSEKFYNEYGKKMLESMQDIMPYVAVGLCGSGSECYGFDDDISKDHDFEPGFCIFIPDENIVSSKMEFQLERAYSRLPYEFMGYKRSNLSPVGGNRHGVIRISDFLMDKTGTRDGEISLMDWFYIPEHALLEATNGKIFFDPYGEITKKREGLKYLPDDVRLKKLAGNLLIMGQSGQYNYQRCIKRNEKGSAQMAIFEFVKATISTVFLLNRKYVPYYKWSFRAMRELPILSSLEKELEALISSGNSEIEAKEKQKSIEKICYEIINELNNQGLTSYQGTEMEGHAYSTNDKIADNTIRNLNILYAIA